jgi:hypothetical protein
MYMRAKRGWGLKVALPMGRHYRHAAAMPEVVIEQRFCGPPASGNGGYTCGLVARYVDGPAEVTLRVPPPLERPLEVRREAAGASLWDHDVLVAEARAAAPELEAPAPVAFDEAREATGHYEWMHDHPYPTCFVCGPRREEGDGLRIFASPVAGREVYAAPWTPGVDLAGADGVVRPEFAWASLDCPSGLVTNTFDGVGRLLLGRLTADVRALPHVERDHVVIAWPIERDGRKLHTGSALFTASGDLLAAARAVWIEVEPLR